VACEEMTRPCRGDRREDREPERSADLLEAFSTAAAGRAWSAGTPSLAAVVTATKYRHGDSNPGFRRERAAS
jgi:hypothetical protein